MSITRRVTCEAHIARGPRYMEVCGLPALWHEPNEAENYCALHAAAMVRAELVDRSDLISIATIEKEFIESFGDAS